MTLSVLISLYNKENVVFFNKAMESIYNLQSYKPEQIVLIEDGPLTQTLYDSVKNWKAKLQGKLLVISLKKNVGLAKALNIGLEQCKGEYIARMDADDISNIDRFKEQLHFLQNNPEIDVVGTWISEIDENNQIVKDEVKYPLLHVDLLDFFAKRDPLAHPTVMFRKTFFEKAGIYSNEVHLAEDTLLWYSGFINGCKFANIPYVGLKFRRSSNFYMRRANWKKSWGLLMFRLFKINRHLKYGIKADLYAIAYFIMSLSPSFIKKWLYNTFR